MQPYGRRRRVVRTVKGHQDCNLCQPPDSECAHAVRARRESRNIIQEALQECLSDPK